MLKRIFVALIIIAVIGVGNSLHSAHAQTTATLALSPTSSTAAISTNFNVTMNLNTAGNPVDGVDIYKIHFNPSILQVVDSDSVVAGVQIAPGSLLANTVINNVDNAGGTITFSQSTPGGTTFTGSGVLGTITFRGIALGTSAITFDFSAGSTSDTNAAYLGVDRLSSVTNSSITITAASSFDFSLTNGGAKTLNQGSTVTNTVTSTLSTGSTQSTSFSASGLPSGVNASFSPTSCSPTCTTTITLTASGSATPGVSTTTVTATAGTVTHTTTFGLTVSTVSYLRTIAFDLEARSSNAISGSLEILNSSKTLIKSYPYTTNTLGTANITIDIPTQIVYLKVKAAQYLTRLLSGIDLSSAATYTFPQLMAGDLNQDNIINSVDYSVLNINWFTTSTAADINQDGLVNSIDYSYMNKHWLVTGE